MRHVASDIMSRYVICVRKDMDLRDLAKLFLERGITGAPVVDEQDDLVGVISQRDILYYNLTRDDELVLDSDFYHRVRVEGHQLPAGFQIEDTNTGRVSEVMTPVVHAVAETTPIESVARMMTRKHIHRVIVRRGRKVAGIISALDILRVYGNATRSRSAPAGKGARGTAKKGATPRGPHRRRGAGASR